MPLTERQRAFNSMCRHGRKHVDGRLNTFCEEYLPEFEPLGNEVQERLCNVLENIYKTAYLKGFRNGKEFVRRSTAPRIQE